MMDNARLSYLIRQIQNNKATKNEQDEYMDYLLESRKITGKQYNDYKKNKNNEDILKIAVIAGASILLGILFNEIFKDQ